MTATIVIIIIILAAAGFGIRASMKHFRGEGGCCGGSCSVPEEPPERKSLSGPKLGEKVIHIEGMHCENCKNKVIRALNRLEGVSAEADLESGTATVSYDREIAEETLRFTVETLDYRVTGIEEQK